MISIQEGRSLYAGAESGHDFDHILRVLAMADRLAEAEGADRDVVHAAALLHDIARSEEDAEAGTALDHAQVAAHRAERWLLARGETPAFARRVAEAIAAHRFRGSLQPVSLEGKILFDADKLDAIGAVGVARAYAIGGRLNQRLYTQAGPDAMATRDQHNSDHSAYAEFQVKLSKLHERLYTATARRIGAERHRFMVDFFERLAREVAGEL